MQKLRGFAFGVAMLTTLIACGGSGGGTTTNGLSDGSGVTTTPLKADTGGVATSASGKLELSIPAGALSSDTEISITESSDSDPLLGRFYELGPDGTTLNTPAEVAFTLDWSDLTGLIDETGAPLDLTTATPEILSEHVSASGLTEPLDITSISYDPDSETLTVTGMLSHFSRLDVTASADHGLMSITHPGGPFAVHQEFTADAVVTLPPLTAFSPDFPHQTLAKLPKVGDSASDFLGFTPEYKGTKQIPQEIYEIFVKKVIVYGSGAVRAQAGGAEPEIYYTEPLEVAMREGGGRSVPIQGRYKCISEGTGVIFLFVSGYANLNYFEYSYDAKGIVTEVLDMGNREVWLTAGTPIQHVACLAPEQSTDENSPDTDGDGARDDVDNCVDVQNTDQADADGDSIGDACDNDRDGDDVVDDGDNCPKTSNADQADMDDDGIGDACDDDIDGDDAANDNDNCAKTANADQLDTNLNSIGDVCDDNFFEIGGEVSGLKGSVVLQNNGGDDLTITADGPYAFPHRLDDGDGYEVSILTQPIGQTCSESTTSYGTVNGADVTDAFITCTTNNYSVGGTVSGLADGETFVLQNNGEGMRIISGNGSQIYFTDIPHGDAYDVSISMQPDTQTCSISGGAGTVDGADVDTVSINCATTTYSVGGAVSGLNGSVVLQNNGGDDISLTTDGSFSFPTQLADGSGYAVTVASQPSGQTCEVTGAAGTLAGADVTNVSVACADTAPATGVEITTTWVVTSDPLGHAQYINMPATQVLTVAISGSDITITGASPFVNIAGTDYNPDIIGFNFTASGAGTVAGYPDIDIQLTNGYVPPEGNTVVGQYTIGGNGGLPGGLPIIYSFWTETGSP